MTPTMTLPEYIPSRYKIAFGGRGSAKSWGFARVLVWLASLFKLRILCARELQKSIAESVYQLLCDQIVSLDLRGFTILHDRILHRNGSEIIFMGVKNDPGKVKSTEGIDILFIEEAEKISKISWDVLIPTIRKKGSEIWAVFNPRLETDPTYKRFVLNMPPRCRRTWINYNDNPWFPEELEEERKYVLRQIAEATDDEERAQLQADYDHVWLGYCQKLAGAAVFRRRVVIEEFPDIDFRQPNAPTLKFGADWGFANDPNALIRFWVEEYSRGEEKWEEMYISHEAYGYHTELDEIPKLFDTVPDVRNWPIKGDCARPETISFVARQGFNLSAAEKWPGSVEDGVAHIKAYRKIHIHKRCLKIAQESRLYQYKVDKVTGEVLPVILDKHNHGWDAVRYGLDGTIQRRGVIGKWMRLAQ